MFYIVLYTKKTIDFRVERESVLLVAMNSAYVENKDLDNLFSNFSVLFGKQFLNVYIWKSEKGLYRNTYFKKDDYLGAYIPNPYRKDRSGLFGEVHLIKRMIGAGYVAHELQHFIYDWVSSKNRPPQNETIALLAGEVTSSFWKTFYKLS